MSRWLWKWSGETQDQGDLGDPTTTADHALCLYAGTSAALASEVFVPADATRWRTSGSSGYRYKDSTGSDDGVQTILLKSRSASSRKLLVKGKGANLPDPMLLLALPLRARLIDRQNAVCWDAVYDSGQVKKNDAGLFKATVSE